MKPVHPAFDITTATWFVEGHEAKSLQALKSLLPPGTKVIGYYPNGFTATHPKSKIDGRAVNLPPRFNPWINRLRQKPIQPELPKETIAPLITPKPKLPQKIYFANKGNKFDHNEVLNLWAQGYSAPEIARKINYPRWLSISHVVWAARKAGDPRAVKRGKGYRHNK